MRRRYSFLSSLLLTAALAAPIALMAAASPQDRDDRNKNHDNKQSENNKRYYDKKHKDYHTWDNNEDSAYQRYQTEHRQKRAFAQLSSRQQNNYWNWRHSNPDNR